MPTIRLANDDDLRAISSQNLDPIFALPWLYVPAEGELMKPWGVARGDGDANVVLWAKQFPDAVVAPRFQGERVARGDLLFHGAEPAKDFAR